MASRNIKVEILGDASNLTRTFHKAGAEAGSFGSRVTGAFKSVAKYGLIASAAAGVVAIEVGKKAAEAAINAQEANDKLTQAFKNQKIAMSASSDAVLKAETAARRLGFTNEDTRLGLTKLIQSGKSYTDSVTELGAAQDLARAKGISLGDATTSLIRLQAGNTRAAKEFGVVLPPVTAAVDRLKASKIDLTTAEGKHLLALARVQDKLATGAAYYDAITGKVKNQAQVFSDSAAGGIARFHAGIQDIEEQLGAHLAPVLGRAASAVADFMDKFSQAQGATAKFHVLVDAVKNVGSDIFNAVKSSLAAVNWNAVWTSVKVDAQGLVTKVNATLSSANWSEVGRTLGSAITKTVSFAGELKAKLTSELAVAARNIDWASVGKAFFDGFTGTGGPTGRLKTALANVWKLDKATFLGPSFATGEAMRKQIESGFGNSLGDNLRKKLTTDTTAKLQAAIQTMKGQVIPTASMAGTQIGAQIAAGAAAGLRASLWAIAQAAIAVIQGAIALAGAATHGSGPFQFTIHAVGEPMAEGVVIGFGNGIFRGIPRMVAAINTAVAAQTKAVQDAKAKYNAAFTQLAQDALAAFDARVAAWIPPAQKMLDKINADISHHDVQNAVDAAQNLAAAAVSAYESAAQQEGETPEEYAKRRAELWQAVLDTDKALKDAQRALLLQGFADQAADQTKHHDAIVAKQRAHLLAVIELYNKFNQPMRDAGQRLTDAFAQGFDQGMAAVIASAKKFTAALEGVTGPVGGGGTGGSSGGPGRPPDVGGKSGRGSSAQTPIVLTVNTLLDGSKVGQNTYEFLLDLKAANGLLGLA